MLLYDKEFGDAICHVEWRFKKLDGKKGYNSGVYVRNSGDGKSSWHIQPTPMPASIAMRIHVVSLLFIASLPFMASLVVMLLPSSGERRDFEARGVDCRTEPIPSV